MKNFFQTLNSNLARRLGFYVILASTLLSILTSGFQIYSEFKRERNTVYAELDQIEKTHLSNIAARLWVLDLDELNDTLSSLLELTSIRYVSVLEGDEIIASAGDSVDSNIIIRRHPLLYTANNISSNLGTLVVKASLDEVYQNVFNRAFLIISSNLIKTIFIAFFILFIFYVLVTRHLSDISNFLLRKHSQSNPDSLILNRNIRKNDELDHLVDSINKMQVTLKEQYDEIFQQQQYLSQTLNSIGDAVIATDVKGNVTQMNPVAQKLTGWSFEDAVGKSINTIFPIIHADTREIIENPVEKVIRTGNIIYLSNNTTLISKDGSEIQISDSAAPIKDDNGTILGMVLAFNDVTEQYELRKLARLNEKKYKMLATVAPVGLFYTDLEGKCLYVNEKWSEISGLSINEAIGDGWADAIHEDDKNMVFREWNRSAENETQFKMEYRFKNKDETKWVLGQALAKEDENGQVDGYVGTITDITERKDAENALNRTQKMDALGKLTGGVAHDYNNMLGVILGYAELLQDKVHNDKELSAYVHEIYEAGSRGAKLTKKLLSFSRQVKTDSEIVDINAIINDEKNMLEKTLTVSINLNLDLSNSLGLIDVDKADLENAIVNLCINARDAMDANGDLTIKTNNVNLDNREYVCLSISDTGCGINNADQDKVFDPFYTTKGDLGTGLGLSQVYGFVERSGGKVNIESKVGKGTCFHLLFPRCNDTSLSDATVDPKEVVKGNSGTESILVVDDELQLLDLVAATLGSKGYVVHTASDGNVALEILERESIDILLSDVVMPQMNGYELAKIVKEKYPNVKIQMASGFTDGQNKINKDEYLHDNLLHKPYRLSDLLKRVRELLDS